MTRQTPAKPFHAQAHAHPFSACTNNPLIPFNNKTKSFQPRLRPHNLKPNSPRINLKPPLLLTAHPKFLETKPQLTPPTLRPLNSQSKTRLPKPQFGDIVSRLCIESALVCCLRFAALADRGLRCGDFGAEACEVRVEIAVCISDFSASSFCKVRAWECEAVVRVEIWERWVRWVSV
jgi:hypothetical protein